MVKWNWRKSYNIFLWENEHLVQSVFFSRDYGYYLLTSSINGDKEAKKCQFYLQKISQTQHELDNE